MSAPFGGPPSLPFNTAEAPAQSVTPAATNVFEDLAKLGRPRKYYQQYYRTREANDNMWRAPQGIHAFLRAYYHFKSADWKQNQPFKLTALTASELAKMPTYYVMDFGRGMAETVEEAMPSAKEIAACKWLTDEELAVYAAEFGRTDFRVACNGTDAPAANTPPSLKRFLAAPSRCRPVSSRVRATWVSTRTPVCLRECKPPLVPNGAVLI